MLQRVRHRARVGGQNSSELQSGSSGAMAATGDTTPTESSHGSNSWDALTCDYDSGLWTHAFCQLPFMNAQLTKLAAQHKSAPWKALDVGCGMGKYTRLLLQAGASSVLAFDISKNMVEGAKLATDKFLRSQLSDAIIILALLHHRPFPDLGISACFVVLICKPFDFRALPESRADFAVASATELSSLPGAQEGTFDLAVCVYLFCNLLSKEEIKQTFAEIFKVLKPGGKLIIYEGHILYYMHWLDKKSKFPCLDIWGAPKQDGADWGYFEDEGNPREMTMKMNSGKAIQFTNRHYTLSSWVSWILEAGFQITQFSEPSIDPKAIPADAPEYAKLVAGKPLEMYFECTKPLLDSLDKAGKTKLKQ